MQRLAARSAPKAPVVHRNLDADYPLAAFAEAAARFAVAAEDIDLPVMPDDELAALQAQPGGSDPAGFDPYEEH